MNRNRRRAPGTKRRVLNDIYTLEAHLRQDRRPAAADNAHELIELALPGHVEHMPEQRPRAQHPRDLAPGQALVSLTSMTRPLLVAIDPTPCKLQLVD